MFKKIIVLQEFTRNGDITYGLYWAHYQSVTTDKWILIARNGDKIQTYSHYYGKSPRECFDNLNNEIENEFLRCLDNCCNVVNLNDFVG